MNDPGRPSSEIEEGEVYFLILHFLAHGPFKGVADQLWKELSLHQLLPRRYHGFYSRSGTPSGAQHDDGKACLTSYRDLLERYPGVGPRHLVALLEELLRMTRKAAGEHSGQPGSAAPVPTLLGSGASSLVEAQRTHAREQEGRLGAALQSLRWPHRNANQVLAVRLREMGGGFAGQSNRPPSVRAPGQAVVKPLVLVDRLQPIKVLRGHRNAVYCAIFDQAGRYFITGSDDRLVKIWSMETGLCLRSCLGHTGDITDLAVSSDNKLVASASNDHTIRVWELASGVPVTVLRGHTDSVTTLAFNPGPALEHQLLSSSEDGTCRTWDARSGQVSPQVYRPRLTEPVAFKSSRKKVLEGTPPPPVSAVLCCAFNADGSAFVTGSADNHARVWDPRRQPRPSDGAPQGEEELLKGHDNVVNFVQFSSCTGMAPRGKGEGGVGAPLPPPLRHASASALDSLVTGSKDGSAIIWKPRPPRHHGPKGSWVAMHRLVGAPFCTPPLGPRPLIARPRAAALPGVNVVAWSLDSKFVLVALMDCRILVWNAASGHLEHTLIGHDKPAFVVDVHPLDARVAMSAGYDGRVILWDLWQGLPLGVFPVSTIELVDGHFAPDGASLIVSDEVGQVYVLSTGSREQWKHARCDQFFLGDYRPLIQDSHLNVLDQETQLPPHERNVRDLLCDATMVPYAEPEQSRYQRRRMASLGLRPQPLLWGLANGPALSEVAEEGAAPPLLGVGTSFLDPAAAPRPPAATPPPPPPPPLPSGSAAPLDRRAPRQGAASGGGQRPGRRQREGRRGGRAGPGEEGPAARPGAAPGAEEALGVGISAPAHAHRQSPDAGAGRRSRGSTPEGGGAGGRPGTRPAAGGGTRLEGLEGPIRGRAHSGTSSFLWPTSMPAGMAQGARALAQSMVQEEGMRGRSRGGAEGALAQREAASEAGGDAWRSEEEESEEGTQDGGGSQQRGEDAADRGRGEAGDAWGQQAPGGAAVHPPPEFPEGEGSAQQPRRSCRKRKVRQEDSLRPASASASASAPETGGRPRPAESKRPKRQAALAAREFIRRVEHIAAPLGEHGPRGSATEPDASWPHRTTSGTPTAWRGQATESPQVMAAGPRLAGLGSTSPRSPWGGAVAEQSLPAGQPVASPTMWEALGTVFASPQTGELPARGMPPSSYELNREDPLLSLFHSPLGRLAFRPPSASSAMFQPTLAALPRDASHGSSGHVEAARWSFQGAASAVDGARVSWDV